MQGAQALAKTLSLRRAKAVIVGEPTGLRIAAAEKGVLDLAIETRGKAAHGAMPHLGENAITKMMRILRGLEGFRGRIALLVEVHCEIFTARGPSWQHPS